jgi:protein-tyrosine phosphatase
MFSKLFGFKKDKQEVAEPGKAVVKDWSFLGTDMHSHLIPGIDDGAQTVEDSIMLIEKLREMGFKSLITTPHIKSDHFPNSKQTIGHGLQILKQALAEKNIDIPVTAAAEYYIDEHFMDLLEQKELLTITGNEVLVEISFMIEPARFHEILFQIQMAGYRPILAHPERYSFYHDKPESYIELKNRGCLLQLNTLALTGYYGKIVKHTAEKCLKEGLYSYCGSDMHHIKHAENLHNILSTDIINTLQKYPFLNSKLQVAAI